ncbi:hypothetical protein AWJ20_3291 [Sugiyamaella lignohabitans]|uniref:3-hydroxyisobutyrate dehydrogenase n=1 Tax=Sugiyamaella lignohabitans TaxID=796027 RepID=A0A167FSP0_9ASCO|nr:uncharacterized protein AWJ20_3291 [Sugiyamaella lignohabitans]ANB15653.1 hypothetical protein AWJ20_3291 [Sugiyamaella lignohabitans]
MVEVKKPRIGFCGLGAMGGGMARHLVSQGFDVVGYDVYPPSVDKFVAAGGKPGKSPADAAIDVEYFIIMVVNSAQTDSVLYDKNDAGISAVEILPAKSTVILCSTTPPDYAKKLRERLRSDIRLLDCPVSGGTIRAANGTLSIFSSGTDEDLDHAHIVLDTIADPLYRIPGGLGMGSVAKMCHQHQAVTNIIMASEIMGLSSVVGLDSQVVYDQIMESTGATWMFGNRVPHMLTNDWATVHSALAIIMKDADIVTSYAKNARIPLPLGNIAEQLYITGTSKGLAKEDDSGLVRLYLPSDKPGLVGDLRGNGQKEVGKEGITIQTVIDILTGFNLAAVAECVHYAERAGMNLYQFRDIIAKGAGNSAIFEIVKPYEAGWTLAKTPEAREIREKLVSIIVPLKPHSLLTRTRKLDLPRHRHWVSHCQWLLLLFSSFILKKFSIIIYIITYSSWLTR